MLVDWYKPLVDEYTIMLDIVTGEPRCVVRTKGGWNSANAIYDMEGNLLVDWSNEYVYGNCIGDNIVRRRQKELWEIWESEHLPEDYHTSLFNYKTSTDYIDGAFDIQLLGKDKVALRGTKGFIGVIDKNGQILSYTPKNLSKELYVYGLGFSGDNEMYDYRFKKIDFSNVTRYERNRYTYAYELNNNIYYHLEDGALLFIGDKDNRYMYFDDEIHLEDNKLYRMADGKREVILDGLDQLYATTYDYRCKYFIGCKSNDIYLFNRNGEVLAYSKDIGILSQLPIYSCKFGISGYGRIPYSLEYGAYRYVTEESKVGILGYDLTVLIEPGIYDEIYLFFNKQNYASIGLDIQYRIPCYLVAGHTVNGTILYDVYDFRGSLIGENFKQVYDIGENRIAGYKGVNIGLMDFNGKWIKKEPYYMHFAYD